LQCKNCGDLVDPQRVELGYDYCLKEECQQRCLKPVRLAALGVNKAADYYVRAAEVLPPPPPASIAQEEDDPAPIDGHGSRRAYRDTPRPRTTLERLHDQEVALDEALARSYEHFRRGEITAKEMDRQRDEMIAAFNRQVMSENIRYRSLLRRRSNGGS
jgi:hypothetical protein